MSGSHLFTKSQFSIYLHLLSVLSEIMLLIPFECFLVPLPHFGSHHIGLEGGVGCQHHGLLKLEPPNQLYLLSFKLLCEYRLGGVQGLWLRGHTAISRHSQDVFSLWQ